jgi:hypothetical protein
MIRKFNDLEFIYEKFSGLDGLTKVSFISTHASDDPFTIVADQKGVAFKGRTAEPIATMSDLQGLAELISEAWKEHKKLVPKISTSFGDG